jgi:uncharacterized protein
MIAGFAGRDASMRRAANYLAAAFGAVLALVTVTAIGVSGPAMAAPAGPSPASLLLAKQIIEIKGVKAMFDPVVIGVVEKAKSMFLQTNFMWSKDINEVAAQMHHDYDNRVNELVDATARVYATHFSEAELKQILAFYQSPLGQKMIVEEPKAVDESMVSAAKWADNLSEDVMAKMRAEMKKRGHDM